MLDQHSKAASPIRCGDVGSRRRTVHGRPSARTKRRPEDTAAGCRVRAEADLLAAVATATDNQRRRLETSAGSWTARAVHLQAVDDELEARKLDSAFASKTEAQ
jgi:hypothetical protein